jgi:hypothetical protein
MALDKVFFSKFTGLPCEYHSTVAAHILIAWGMNNKPVGGRSSEIYCSLLSRLALTLAASTRAFCPKEIKLRPKSDVFQFRKH